MANVDRTRGFRPVKYQNGSPWNGRTETFVALSATSAIFIGDLVYATGLSDSNGVQQVLPFTTTSNNAVSGPIVGVVVGVGFNPLNLNTGAGTYAVTSDTINRLVYVVSDPNVIFEVQADSAMDFADVGYYCDVTLSQTGSITTGMSGMELDASSVVTSTDRLLQIIGTATMVDNEISNDSAKIIVKLNSTKHQRGTGAAI